MKSENLPTVKEKVHKNCWDCDNIAVHGNRNCKCSKEERRMRKRSAKQKFKRDLREDYYSE